MNHRRSTFPGLIAPLLLCLPAGLVLSAFSQAEAGGITALSTVSTADGNESQASEKSQIAEDPCKWCTPCSSTPGSECLKCCTPGKRAEAAVAKLEKGLSRIEFMAAGKANSAPPAKPDVQKELDKEHKKAREGGYDKEFHGAIRDKGGERLKEEWKRNCNSRAPNKRELNCY